VVLAGPLLVATVSVTACQSGPAAIASGDYRAYAASSEVGSAPRVTLTIDGSTLTFGENDVLTTAELGESTDEYLVCPPSGKGAPSSLGPPLSLGPATFDSPAVIGDCGSAAPVRVTIVDLSSVNEEQGPFPFTRWIEFCASIDPDC
jgi:hypothetical protein